MSNTGLPQMNIVGNSRMQCASIICKGKSYLLFLFLLFIYFFVVVCFAILGLKNFRNDNLHLPQKFKNFAFTISLSHGFLVCICSTIQVQMSYTTPENVKMMKTRTSLHVAVYSNWSLYCVHIKSVDV